MYFFLNRIENDLKIIHTTLSCLNRIENDLKIIHMTLSCLNLIENDLKIIHTTLSCLNDYEIRKNRNFKIDQIEKSLYL